MKIFKKTVAIISAIICVCAILFAFTACETKHESIVADRITFAVSGETVVVNFIDKDGKSETVYNDAYQGYYLSDLIFFLAGKNVFTVKSTDSGYGAFFTQIGSVEQNAAQNEYLYFYTDIDKYIDTTDFALTIEIDGKTLTSASVGASGMVLSEGAFFAVGLVKW